MLTTHDVARLLAVHPFTVGRHIDKGQLKGFRTAGGHRRVLATELMRFARAHGLTLPSELGETGAERNLLVVDDEQLSLNAIKRAFKPFAGEVELTTTTSSIEALLLAGELKPDALLVDVQMPDLDGFELCKRVLAFPSLAGIKVVAMTAHLKTDVLGSALRAGALACLEKPVDPKEVLALLAPKPARRVRLKAG